MTIPYNNPIRDVHDALFAMLNAKKDFAQMFPPDTPHQVGYVNADQPYEPLDTPPLPNEPSPNPVETNAGEYPRVRIRLAKATPQMSANSSGCILDTIYIVEIDTGQCYQNVAMDACWAIFHAGSDWQTQLRAATSWNDNPFVVWAEPMEVEIEEYNQSAASSRYLHETGHEHWQAVWAWHIKMEFVTSELKTYMTTS